MLSPLLVFVYVYVVHTFSLIQHSFYFLKEKKKKSDNRYLKTKPFFYRQIKENILNAPK